MSNLLKALASPPFDYYPPWESKDEGESVLKQPDQIKVQYSAPVERANTDKDMVGYVVPDQGSNAEFFLTFTLPMFKANIVDRLHPSARGNDKLLLSLMAKCLQGVAVNIWEQVLDEQKTAALGELAEDADESALDYNGLFKTVVQHYLEEVQGLKFIGDAAIRFLQGSNKKPATMTPAKFFRRRATILGFVTGGYLRYKLSVPTNVQLNEAAFLACARVWQEKYAETNDEVSTDTSKLISAFSAYHTADIRAGTLKKLQKEKEEKAKKTAQAKTAQQDNRRGGRRPGRGFRSRDDRREYRDDRGYQRDRFHDRRDQRDGQKGQHDKQGHKKQPYKRSAREEAHHVNEERDRSRSRSRSASRSRSPASYRSSDGSRGEEGFHTHRGSNHGEAQGSIEYDSDMDDRPQDRHKSHVENGYRTFNAPKARGKR